MPAIVTIDRGSCVSHYTVALTFGLTWTRNATSLTKQACRMACFSNGSTALASCDPGAFGLVYTQIRPGVTSMLPYL